ATTNTSGIATSAVFTANATAGGPYNVVASAAGATSANFSLTNLSAPAATVVIGRASWRGGAINAAFGAALVETVTEAGDSPGCGAVVTIPAGGNAGGRTFAGAITATTKTSGVATSAVFTANATAGGPYNVVASAAGATSANFSLTNLSAPPATV